MTCDVNLARYDGAAGTATELLRLHFRRIAEQAGAQWGPEQDTDIDTLVAALQQAMRQEAWGVVHREVFGGAA
jgi:hypothetical protein